MAQKTLEAGFDRSTVKLRQLDSEDETFLLQLYATTRSDLEQVPWEDEFQKAAFLAQQFRAQHNYYLEQFSEAAFDLILLNGKPIGRLYLDRRAGEIRILDLAILPAFRNQGIGALVLKEILDEGAQTKLAVTTYLLHNDPARRLYERLGFVKTEEKGFHHLLEWRPGPTAN